MMVYRFPHYLFHLEIRFLKNSCSIISPADCRCTLWDHPGSYILHSVIYHIYLLCSDHLLLWNIYWVPTMCQGTPMLNINTRFLLSGNLQSGGETEINQIITLKSNTLQRCPAPCKPSAGIWCMNTSVISAMKERRGCDGQAEVNKWVGEEEHSRCAKSLW